MTTIEAQTCAEPPLTTFDVPTNLHVALYHILKASEEHKVSPERLWALAQQRTKLEPRFSARIPPRFPNYTEYRGLFGFQTTQWIETLTARGWSLQDARNQDIFDPALQADNAAWLMANNRPIRGDIRTV